MIDKDDANRIIKIWEISARELESHRKKERQLEADIDCALQQLREVNKELDNSKESAEAWAKTAFALEAFARRHIEKGFLCAHCIHSSIECEGCNEKNERWRLNVNG